MLNKPPLCNLLENVDSKYGLIIMVSKRARSVIDNNPDVVSTRRFNAVSMAMREVAEGKLHWSTGAAKAPDAAAKAPAAAAEADLDAVEADKAEAPETEAES